MKTTSALIGFALGVASVAVPAQTLEQRFANPTESAKPRTWWHWIDGNITRSGIQRDLEWMQRIGIGGFQLFDVGRNYPVLVEQPVPYMSPEWKAMVGYTAAEATRLGLEMSMISSAGWSETGGPHVKPAAAMKKLVWSERRVQGGQRYQGKLPLPPVENGLFQDIGLKPPFKVNGGPESKAPRLITTHYADVRVIAYRVPVADAVPVAVSASAGTPDLALLRDGGFNQAFVMPAQPGQDSWVQFDFGAPVSIRSLRMGLRWPADVASNMPKGSVTASDDGVSFRQVAPLPDPGTAGGLPIYTVALPETHARYFRLVAEPGSGFTWPGLPKREIKEFQFTEIDFSAQSRPHRQEAKAAFTVLADPPDTPAVASDTVVGKVLDISDRMRADGSLDWTPPEGEWSVIRFGSSLTGQINAPATPAGTGFEVDKYSASDVREYLDGYYGPILAAVGKHSGAQGLQALLTDSWEAGSANWTPKLIEEFRARRGYDPTPWLPVLADHIVGSAELSDRFLWDFRRTLADLVADNHYKVIADYAREHKLGYYGEAMGVDLPMTGDGLQYKRYPSVPMGEFWQTWPDKPSLPNHIADVREAASAAHVYGQNIVATESFTGFPLPGYPPAYSVTPWMLKPLADRFMAQGVNRFIMHTAAHQPLEQGPGFSLSIFGQFFSRLETWGEHAKAWMSYLARSSELLQQGHYAADIAYFYGEGAPVTVAAGAVTDPVIPAGYAFDFVGRDMLLKDLQMKDGRLTAISGTSYKLLVLPAKPARISLQLAQRLRELVTQGLVLIGPRPLGAAGLSATDEQVNAVTAELWGDLDGAQKTSRTQGRGRVYWGLPLDQVLATEKLSPDVSFTAEKLVSIHRSLKDGEIYFIANQNATAVQAEASLRTSGREAELWHADDARIEAAAYRESEGRTIVPLSLAPYEAVFVVLRKPAKQKSRAVSVKTETKLATVEGSWSVAFTPGRGAPAQAQLPALESWTRSGDEGVRYFSGTGTYDKSIEVSAGWLKPGRRIVLDLGEVHETAQVWVNGKDAGIAWKPPYRVDVTALVKPGRNELRIAVANLWANRIIGDKQPDAKKPIAFSTFDYYWPSLIKLPYAADSPLPPAGLLGPVQILAVQ